MKRNSAYSELRRLTENLEKQKQLLFVGLTVKKEENNTKRSSVIL